MESQWRHMKHACVIWRSESSQQVLAMQVKQFRYARGPQVRVVPYNCCESKKIWYGKATVSIENLVNILFV